MWPWHPYFTDHLTGTHLEMLPWRPAWYPPCLVLGDWPFSSTCALILFPHPWYHPLNPHRNSSKLLFLSVGWHSDGGMSDHNRPGEYNLLGAWNFLSLYVHDMTIPTALEHLLIQRLPQYLLSALFHLFSLWPPPFAFSLPKCFPSFPST